jgi:predicted Na+-dependent transporter
MNGLFMHILLILNAAAAAFAAVFSVVASFRPQIVPPHQDDRGPFLHAYTGRAVGLAVLAIPVLLHGVTPVAALAALALGLGQAGDIAAFLRVGDRRMAAGASIATLIHVASAVVIALAIK